MRGSRTSAGSVLAVCVASVMLLASGCVGGSPSVRVDESAGTSDGVMDDGAADDAVLGDASTDDSVGAEEPVSDTSDRSRNALYLAARERCLAAAEVFDRRLERGEEFPDDDAPELTEEELEQMLAPEYVGVDGVAAPDDRPVIEPIVAFDPETAPLLDLDYLVWICIEGSIVTESELFDESDEEFDADQGDEDEDD